MPVSYQIDHSRGIIHTKCSGDVTLAEVLDHFRVLSSDPECPARLDVLLDLSECTSETDSEQLRTVSHAIASVRDRVRFGACAIVAPTDLLFGIGRMFEAVAEERFRVTHVFRSVAQADAWLGSQRSSAPASAPGE